MLGPTDLLHPTPSLHFKGFQSCDVLLSHSPYFCTVQGHISNQCFHHSFLEASSFFSILPLMILSYWKGLLSHCYPGASILPLRIFSSGKGFLPHCQRGASFRGREGRAPRILGGGGAGRVAGGSLE